jgi:GrpB-like predicted nucleotidyltransferase (UPF0157 family)
VDTEGRQRPRPPEANYVVPYDDDWVRVFEAIHHRLTDVFDDRFATVEHVGSTAVPGLAAKPIVDVDVVVADERDIPLAIERLRIAGYVHQGDLGVLGREAFDAPIDLPYHHLYLVVAGSRPHRDHIDLRDYLRANPEARTRYSKHKLSIAYLITQESRQAYLEAKANLIAELLDAARLAAD